jgi:hypothetical protein
LLREVTPLSQDLSMTATTGLLALGYLDKSELAPQEWKTQQLSQLDSAAKSKAALMLTVIEPVRQLVQASAGQGQ